MNALEAQRWSAVVARDRKSTFIFGVVTTRVACRPGCPSRTPRRENVRFFDDFGAALAEGFRACKRCAPDDVAHNADRQRLVARACALIDNNEAIHLDDVASSIGVSRFHFQRIFRETLGLTPGEYRRARREARLRAGLRGGKSVTEAIQDAGYGTPSRAYASVSLGMAPATYRKGGRGERITFACTNSSLGTVLLAQSAQGICAIELGDDEAAVLAALRRDLPHAEFERDDVGLARRLRDVVAVVDGDANASCLTLDIRGSAFQRRVWNALAAIPSGESRSYASVAREIGMPNGARAVATACARNPFAVAIACHRVVGADGELKGYRWGIERKAALRKREAFKTLVDASAPSSEDVGRDEQAGSLRRRLRRSPK